MLLRAATRGSALALWQTNRVAELLAQTNPEVEIETVVVETTGDQNQTTPLHQMGGQGVFVKEVQAAVLNGRADFAVHSAKDLPAAATPGLVLVAIPERADPRDVLVGARWADLPAGAIIATGSVRRRAHLAHLRPDLNFAELRGNIATRLEKAADFAAIVMAKAALDRLGLTPAVVDVLPPEVLLPQVGQGALAIECRTDDAAAATLLASISNQESMNTVGAERAFLAELGAGCDLPIAAHAVMDHGEILLTGAMSSFDGTTLLRDSGRSTDGLTLGASLARCLRDDQGGGALLDQS
ncbi:MAG: hydroxymethylbilane synthase [Acidimicrobiales bacterium]|jgi:hydroxymethylbilane synthase|nr:hydroxymethylbilane synthase [Acidimicrobiales bacterium]